MNQFEYVDKEEGIVFSIQFLPLPEKQIIFTCHYLTSPLSAPPLYVTTVSYTDDRILWDSIRVGSNFFSPSMKNYIDKMFKLKAWW